MSLSHIFQTGQTYTTTQLSSEEAAAMTGIMVVFLIAIVFLVAVPSIMTLWQLFKKAGKGGWEAIVPLYNTYVMGEIAGKVPLAIGMIICGLLSGIPLIGIIPALASVVLLFVIVFTGLANKYDYGTGFWLLYIFLPIVAVFMVGKGNYIGGNPQQYAPVANGMQPNVNQSGVYAAPQPVVPQPPVVDAYAQQQPAAAPQVPVAPVAQPQSPQVQAPVATQGQDQQQVPPQTPTA